MVWLRKEILGRAGTSKSKVMNALLEGEILPSGCIQVTSNICIEGAAVEALEYVAD